MITLNTPGARTQWIIDGQGVYVTFSGDVAELHIGGRIVADRPAAEVTAIVDAQDWAVEYLAAQDEIAAEQLAETIEHMEAAEVDPAVEAVREAGREMLRQAAEAVGTEPVRVPRMRNGEQRGWVTLSTSDPRHPARHAEALRQAGARLVRWTEADETGYNRYVSDGLADTDGWFIPMARESWAA